MLNLSKDSELEVQILKRCYYLLLLLVSPDALIRLEKTKLQSQKKEFYNIYFEQQKHSSLIEFIKNQLQDVRGNNDGISMQV